MRAIAVALAALAAAVVPAASSPQVAKKCRGGVEYPSFSPSGKWVAYERYVGRGLIPDCTFGTDLEIVRADGKRRRTIVRTTSPGGLTCWQWAPRSDRLAVVTTSDLSDPQRSTDRLFLVRPGFKRHLTTKGSAVYFEWSPGGRKLAVARATSPRSKHYELIVV